MNLLVQNGPSTLPEATKISAGPHNTQASTSHYVQRPPSVQDPKHIAKSDVPSSFYEHKSRLSPHPKNFDSSNTSANNSISSGAYHPRSKPQRMLITLELAYDSILLVFFSFIIIICELSLAETENQGLEFEFSNTSANNSISSRAYPPRSKPQRMLIK